MCNINIHKISLILYTYCSVSVDKYIGEQNENHNIEYS